MTNTNQSVIIKTQNIGMNFPVKSMDVWVLTDLSLTVHKGEFLVIFGPSGCGKSTLLHILLGLEIPTCGIVSFYDTSLYDIDEDRRTEFRKKHVGMVYQQPNWIKALTVRENIIFALRLNGFPVRVVNDMSDQVLRKVGMLQWADNIPTELSSGQQQKVALARSIVTNPDILIADEPTGNLDYESGQELMTLLSELNAEGKTIIMVTHDLEYLTYATRAIEMLNGKIIHEINDPTAFIKDNGITLKRGSKNMPKILHTLRT